MLICVKRLSLPRHNHHASCLCKSSMHVPAPSTQQSSPIFLLFRSAIQSQLPLLPYGQNARFLTKINSDELSKIICGRYGPREHPIHTQPAPCVREGTTLQRTVCSKGALRRAGGSTFIFLTLKKRGQFIYISYSP